MSEFLNQIPSFWQGVLASLVAAIIFTIAVFLGRTWIAGCKDWLDQGKKRREKLRTEFKKGNDLQKTHVSLRLIFTTLKWLFIGNILWVAPEAILPFIYLPPVYLLKVASLICFAIGLSWVSSFADVMRDS